MATVILKQVLVLEERKYSDNPNMLILGEMREDESEVLIRILGHLFFLRDWDGLAYKCYSSYQEKPIGEAKPVNNINCGEIQTYHLILDQHFV